MESGRIAVANETSDVRGLSGAHFASCLVQLLNDCI
jgi:hypothetical protein